MRLITEMGEAERRIESETPVVVVMSMNSCTFCADARRALQNIECSCGSQDIEFVEIDIGSLKDIAEKYSIESAPTVIIFRNGIIIEHMVGAAKIPEYETAIRRIFEQV